MNPGPPNSKPHAMYYTQWLSTLSHPGGQFWLSQLEWVGWLPEVGDAAKHPTMCGAISTTKDYFAPDVRSAEAQKQ